MYGPVGTETAKALWDIIGPPYGAEAAEADAGKVPGVQGSALACH